MSEGPPVTRIAALIGDPARANMLVAMMQGGAMTVSELSEVAGVGLSTASSHASQLVDGGLVRMRPSGRHRYMELAAPEVAALLERMMSLAEATLPPQQLGPKRAPGPRDPALREARVCYDHLAGAMGVQLYDSLVGRGFLAHGMTGLSLGSAGLEFMVHLGLTQSELDRGKAPLCRECLDWSQRRSHLAGRLGRMILARLIALNWLGRIEGSRALRVSASGRRAFDAAFPLNSVDDPLDAGTL